MKNYNIAIISGVTASDMRVSLSSNNLVICSFSIAHNYKDKKGADKVSFFDCVCFGRTAEIVSKELTKGMPVYLQGELKQENYIDNQGNRKTFVRIYADVVYFEKKENKAQEYKPKNDDKLESVELPKVNISEEEIPF